MGALVFELVVVEAIPIMTTFTLMRHGQADFEAMEDRKLIGGCRDWIPLSSEGIRQTEEKAEKLRASEFDLILASPMSRALHTAAILSKALDVPMHVEFDLHEWLPDLTFRFESFEPVQRAIEERNQHGNEWPTGETRTWEPFSQVRKRVRAVLERYTSAARVLVVCHHTVIMACTGEKLPLAGSISWQFPFQDSPDSFPG